MRRQWTRKFPSKTGASPDGEAPRRAGPYLPSVTLGGASSRGRPREARCHGPGGWCCRSRCRESLDFSYEHPRRSYSRRSPQAPASPSGQVPRIHAREGRILGRARISDSGGPSVPLRAHESKIRTFPGIGPAGSDARNAFEPTSKPPLAACELYESPEAIRACEGGERVMESRRAA
jgi:hypothetical protein